MATPIKQLLKPKVLSPIITQQLNKNLFLSNSSVLIENVACVKNFTNKLSVLQPNQNNSPLFCDLTTSRRNVSPIKIEISDFDERFIINTPNKKCLLENGLGSSKNVEILGKGSFGTVVHGIHKGLDVAVKIVRLSKNISTLTNEKNALKLDHKNVVRTIDVIENNKYNNHYGMVVMEYLMDSRHLQNILDDPNMDLDEKMIRKYALDVCEGLQHCHQHGVLHLDIKPSNVLVCKGSLCKICDFGNSKDLNDGENFTNQESQTYLNTSHQNGTVAYTAPEILLGKSPTVKSDVFSLGILLWQMRYRKIPYAEHDCVEVIIYRVVKFGDRPSLNNNSKKKSDTKVFEFDRYSSIYSSCWASNPNYRPDISFVAKALKKLC